jgi:hypothetical protein
MPLMGTAGWRGMVGAMKRSPTVIVKKTKERREEKRREERNRHC